MLIENKRKRGGGYYGKVLNKEEYTVEIMYESDDEAIVALEVYGFSPDEMNQAMDDATDRLVDSVTDEDQLAIVAGEMEVLTAYMRQYIRDYLDELSNCFPSDMEEFTSDIDNVLFQ